MHLSVKDINKSFGPKQVLNGISFEARPGSAYGLLGRNGAGKTTTIRIIMGVFPADSGEILIDGEKASKSSCVFGYLPEERGLYPKQTILDQMVYFGMLKGMNKSDAKQSGERWLARLSMSDTASVKLNTLSKGNQQKIQLAVTLIDSPDIVILDEPFSGLDPVNARLLKDIVGELIEDKKTVIFSSHQMSYVEEFCSDIAIIGEGKVLCEGVLSEIKRGYDRNNILVRFGENTPDIAALKAAAGDIVVDIAPHISHNNNGGGGYIFKLAAPEYSKQLMETLSRLPAAPELFSVLEPSLEDIFIEKAGATNAE